MKNLPASAGDVGLIPGFDIFPGEENGNPLQHSCLGNPMDRGAWWATVHGVATVGHNLMTKLPTTKMCSFQLKIHQEITTKSFSNLMRTLHFSENFNQE